MFFVYLLRSKVRPAELYVGSTNKLKKRLAEHNNGQTISTRRYRPWSLMYIEGYISEQNARIREQKLKHHGNAMKEVKRRIGLLPSKQRVSKKSGAGFTLIELLISIAIVGILSALMFSNFSQEKDRNDLKTTVHQLQTDFQTMQTNAQGGVVMGASVPAGYGINLTSTTSYILYADNSPALGDNKYTAGSDTPVRTTSFPSSTGVSISKITPSTAKNIIFSSPNGTAKITDSDGSSVTSPVVLFLKSTKLNVCYSITITAGVGTVSQKKFENLSAC